MAAIYVPNFWCKFYNRIIQGEMAPWNGAKILPTPKIGKIGVLWIKTYISTIWLWFLIILIIMVKKKTNFAFSAIYANFMQIRRPFWINYQFPRQRNCQKLSSLFRDSMGTVIDRIKIPKVLNSGDCPACHLVCFFLLLNIIMFEKLNYFTNIAIYQISPPGGAKKHITQNAPRGP